MLTSGNLSFQAMNTPAKYSSPLPKFYLQQEGFKCPQEQQYTLEKHKNKEKNPCILVLFGNCFKVMQCYKILCKSILASSFESCLAISIQRNPRYVHCFYHIPFKWKENLMNQAIPPFKTISVKDTLHCSGCQLPGALVYWILSSSWVF